MLASATQMRHELLYVGPQLDTQMYLMLYIVKSDTKKYEKGTDGDKMLPDIAMELMNPIATARLELERANVLLIQVNKITFETCD
jgi:hypothetical protein